MRLYDDVPPTERELRNPWTAPEHFSGRKGMRRNRDPKSGPIGHFVVDKRPAIILPTRKTYTDGV